MADVITRFKVESSEYEKKIGRAKGKLNEFDKGVNDLSRSLGVNVGALTKATVAIGAISAAVKVAKDAFMASESNIDEWGRTLESAKGSYDVFIQTINGGGWSNFFTNLSSAVQGARDLYDALDRLGSVKANNSAAIAIVQQELAQLRLLQQSGKEVSSQIKAKTQELRSLQGQSVAAGKTAGRAEIGTVLRNGYNSNAGANKLSDQSVKWATDQILKKGQAFFDSQKGVYDRLKKRAEVAVTRSSTNQYGGTSTYTTKEVDLGRLTDSERKQYLLAKTITERETALQKGIGTYASAVNEQTGSDKQEYKYNRYALQGAGGKSGGGKSGGSGGTDKLAEAIAKAQQQFNGGVNWMEGAPELDEYTQKVEKLKELYSAAGIAEEGFGESLLPAFETDSIDYYTEKIKELSDLMGTLAIGSDAYNDVAEKINETQKKLDLKKANALEKAGDDSKVSWQGAAQAVSGLGGALQSINDPMANVMGIVAEAIANVASGLMSAFAKDNTMGIWGKIAAGISATATMISMIQSIHSATGYANGGIVRAANGAWVPGNSMSGDMVPAMLNSGELVLNKAQQGNLASQLGDGGVMKNLRLETTIREDKLVVMLNNGLRKRGKGTLVTSR